MAALMYMVCEELLVAAHESGQDHVDEEVGGGEDRGSEGRTQDQVSAESLVSQEESCQG